MSEPEPAITGGTSPDGDAVGPNLEAEASQGHSSIPRRHLFGYAGAAGVGLAVGAGTMGALRQPASQPISERPARSYSPNELHQAGITTPTPAYTRLLAFDLIKPAVDPLVKLLKLWSGDVEALMAGRPVPGDPNPDLAAAGVSLTVTIGFGPGIFELPGLADKRPTGFVEIPAMSNDRLQPAWTGGDLLAIVAAEDATSVDYAARRLTADATTFAQLRWVQEGSWRGTNANGEQVTGRNLFGQLDGTGNPNGQLLQDTVWAADPLPWFVGGTTLVVRRIQMDLGFWDRTTRERQELVIGRRLDTGAPLTGTDEYDALDLAAVDEGGRPVIPVDAHARRAHPEENDQRRILRRGINYTRTDLIDGVPVVTAGLVFMSFQANIARQFVPIQNRLDARDALNDWTSAIGSAVFAIPGGFAAGDWLGRALFD